MGGNALPEAGTRRFKAGEYYQVEGEVVNRLKNLFPASLILPIKAYASKESFGDADILVESDFLPTSWVDDIIKEFSPRGHFKNGNVLSFEFMDMQIDAICMQTKDFHSAYQYHNYNDLGNLLGRVAHKLGLKLGHDGLSYVWRIDSHAFRTITLLKDWKDILPVLGYSYERYAEGFDTLEDIFEFVVSSRFFNKAIYELDNRNHTSRTRDRKRKTYTEFLKWIESYEETPTQRFGTCETAPNVEGKAKWLPYLFRAIPGFKEQYEATQKDYDEAVAFKQRWNGDLVREWTGLEGKELGGFMKWMREHYIAEKLKADVMKINSDILPTWTKYFVEKWKKSC